MGPWIGLHRCGKSRPPPGFDPLTVQPVASRYTECATRPTKERRGYSHLKEEALDRTMWRARFGRGFGPVVRQTTKG